MSSNDREIRDRLNIVEDLKHQVKVSNCCYFSNTFLFAILESSQ